MFSELNAICESRGFGSCDPQEIHMDFETAAMTAITQVFGAGTKFVGCLFHLS